MDRVMLAHGSGGKLTRDLIETLFLRRFSNPVIRRMEDSAEIKAGRERLAFTTDSYVVDPIFFPGGDIGRIAVSGTVNDLAVKGAAPIGISASFIIEEGFAMGNLEKITDSMKKTAEEAGVPIITGDTKVVEKGKADGIYINTSGVGLIKKGLSLGTEKIKKGDKIILSGTLADHGMAVMNERTGLGLRGNIKSDGAPLNKMISGILRFRVKCMRDLTRGGLATALAEIAQSSGKDMRVEEGKIKISQPVKSACDILGIDPLYVANEGKIIIFADPADAGKVLDALRKERRGKNASIIGEVGGRGGKAYLKTRIGGERLIIMLEGEQLPRIC